MKLKQTQIMSGYEMNTAVSSEDIKMNDEENIALIKQTLKDYEDGALIEARDALATVVERIDALNIALYDLL